MTFFRREGRNTHSQHWEQDLANAINTTSKNISFLRTRGDTIPPSFSEVIIPEESRIHRPNQDSQSRASNYFELKANEAFDSSAGVGITRPLPKHVEDDLTMRISNSIKRSVERTMQEKFTSLQSALSQVQAQICKTDQHEERNSKLVSSVLRSLPVHEQSLKAISNEVELLKEVTDRLESDTTSVKAWKDLVESNLKTIRQSLTDMCTKFTNISDVREALEMIATNIGSTFHRAMEAIKMDVDRDFKCFRSDLLSNEKEIKLLTEKVGAMTEESTRRPLIDRDDLTRMIENVFHSELASLERRLKIDCEKFWSKSHDELKTALDQVVKKAVQAHVEQALHESNCSQYSCNFINEPRDKNISEMIETIMNDKLDNFLLPSISKELKKQHDSQRWKQILEEDLFAKLNMKVTEMTENRLLHCSDKKDKIAKFNAAIISEMEVRMIEHFNTRVEESKKQLEALIAQAADQNRSIITDLHGSSVENIEILRKQLVTDLFEVKSKIKVTQGLCRTVEESLGVVKAIDSKVDMIQSMYNIQEDTLANVNVAIASIQGQVNTLNAEFQEINVNTTKNSEHWTKCCVDIVEQAVSSKFDQVELKLATVENHGHQVDQQLNDLIMNVVLKLESRISDLHDILNDCRRKEESIMHSRVHNCASLEEEQQSSSSVTNDGLLARLSSGPAEIHEEGRVNQYLDENPTESHQELYEEANISQLFNQSPRELCKKVHENLTDEKDLVYQSYDKDHCNLQLSDNHLPSQVLMHSSNQTAANFFNRNDDHSTKYYDSDSIDEEIRRSVVEETRENSEQLCNWSYEEFEGVIQYYDYIENVQPIENLQLYDEDVSSSDCISDDFESESQEDEEETESLQTLPSIRN